MGPVLGSTVDGTIDVDERRITYPLSSKLLHGGRKREVDPSLCAFSSSRGKTRKLLNARAAPEDLGDGLHERLVPFGAKELQTSLLKEKATRAALGWDTLPGVVEVVEEGPPTLTRRLRGKLQAAHVR